MRQEALRSCEHSETEGTRRIAVQSARAVSGKRREKVSNEETAPATEAYASKAHRRTPAGPPSDRPLGASLYCLRSKARRRFGIEHAGSVPTSR